MTYVHNDEVLFNCHMVNMTKVKDGFKFHIKTATGGDLIFALRPTNANGDPLPVKEISDAATYVRDLVEANRVIKAVDLIKAIKN